MKRGGPLQRRTPLRSVPADRPSSKGPRPSGLRRTAMRRKRARNAEDAAFWAAAREALFARSGGRCEIGGESLDRTGLEAHHRKLRSQGGRHGFDNLLALCPMHHSWCHREPATAREGGWMVSREADPATVPVQLHDGGEVFLTPLGGYTTDAAGRDGVA